MKLSDEIDQILHASAEPIQLPNDESVTLAKGFLRLGENGSFGAAAGDLIFDNLLTADFCQGFGLQDQVLILGGNTRITDQHVEVPLRRRFFIETR